jgi:hypothetical protein
VDYRSRYALAFAAARGDPGHFFGLYPRARGPLGHRDVVMVAKVYGRFVPTSQDRDRWETIAAKLDEEKWGRAGTSGGTSDEKALESSDSSAFTDGSRGGTRTLDPGIMSAVL